MKSSVLTVRDIQGRAHRVAAASAGFTLIEMLVVLAIIGLLVGLVAPRVLGILSDAKIKTAHIQIESFKNALDLYYLDEDSYPNTSQGLGALAVRPPDVTSWNGPYLKGGAVPRDPWNNPYIYRSPGEDGRPYDIISLGEHTREGDGSGGGSEIRSW
jgi:general secretion pathway protein G